MRPQLPTFDAARVYLMTGSMLNRIMDAIRSIVPRAGSGLEELETKTGIELSVVDSPISAFAASPSTTGIQVAGGWYREGADGDWIEIEAATVSGPDVWLEISTNSDCTITNVVIAGGTMPDVTTVTGSPAYVSTSRFQLSGLNGTGGDSRITQYAAGNMTIGIWDINGYAARWPSMQGGTR